jgi:hypothetical protein
MIFQMKKKKHAEYKGVCLRGIGHFGINPLAMRSSKSNLICMEEQVTKES